MPLFYRQITFLGGIRTSKQAVFDDALTCSKNTASIHTLLSLYIKHQPDGMMKYTGYHP
jgi:hypothetical protein